MPPDAADEDAADSAESQTADGCGARDDVSRVEGAASNTHAVPAFGDAKSYAIPAAEVFGFAFLLNQVNRHTDGTDFDNRSTFEAVREPLVS